MKSALQIIEETYEMALNPTQDYLAQLGVLAPSGELASRISANKVLFKLCEIVDKQAAQIKVLEDDRVFIAKKILELQKQLKSTEEGPKPEIKNDEKTSNRPEPDTDNNL